MTGSLWVGLIVGVMPSLATLGVALINGRKLRDVQKLVNGQHDAAVAKIDELRLELAVERLPAGRPDLAADLLRVNRLPSVI